MAGVKFLMRRSWSRNTMAISVLSIRFCRSLLSRVSPWFLLFNSALTSLKLLVDGLHLLLGGFQLLVRGLQLLVDGLIFLGGGLGLLDVELQVVDRVLQLGPGLA